MAQLVPLEAPQARLALVGRQARRVPKALLAAPRARLVLLATKAFKALLDQQARTGPRAATVR